MLFAIHLNRSKEWFRKEKIFCHDKDEVLKLWKTFGVTLCDKVYADNEQFISANELEVAIVKEWHNISESELNYLVTSMINKVSEVIRKNGGSISH